MDFSGISYPHLNPHFRFNQLAFSACLDGINRASSLAFMGAVSKLSQGQARRIYARSENDDAIGAEVFGISVPSILILLRLFYGRGWVRQLSRRHGICERSVYASVSGDAALPRSFISDALAEYRDPAKRAAWERLQRAELERELARRIERRAACARWFELLLNGGAQLPSVNRWRAWKSGRVENFLGKADL